MIQEGISIKNKKNDPQYCGPFDFKFEEMEFVLLVSFKFLIYFLIILSSDVLPELFRPSNTNRFYGQFS